MMTVGAADITVTALGRWIISGSSHTHTIRIDLEGGGNIVTAVVDAVGAPNGFKYTSITPVVLSAGVSYWVGSSEAVGGDPWFDDGTTYTTRSDAAIITSAYQSGGDWTSNHAGSFSYVPPNFQYTVGTTVTTDALARFEFAATQQYYGQMPIELSSAAVCDVVAPQEALSRASVDGGFASDWTELAFKDMGVPTEFIGANDHRSTRS